MGGFAFSSRRPARLKEFPYVPECLYHYNCQNVNSLMSSRDDAKVYPSEYFCLIDYRSGEVRDARMSQRFLEMLGSDGEIYTRRQSFIRSRK